MSESTRPERSTRRKRAGEIAISAMVTILVAIGVVGSLPDSSIKSFAKPLLAPVTRATGLDQGWGVFSPNPPRRLTEVEVHVFMSDGEHRVWRLDADRSLPDYRWRKLKEEVIRLEALRPGLARYVIGQVTGPNERAVRVVMVAQTVTLPLPGEGEPKKVRKLIFDRKVKNGIDRPAPPSSPDKVTTP